MNSLENCLPPTDSALPVVKFSKEKGKKGNALTKLPLPLIYSIMNYLKIQEFWKLPRVNRTFHQLTRREKLASAKAQILSSLIFPAVRQGASSDSGFPIAQFDPSKAEDKARLACTIFSLSTLSKYVLVNEQNGPTHCRTTNVIHILNPDAAGKLTLVSRMKSHQCLAVDRDNAYIMPSSQETPELLVHNLTTGKNSSRIDLRAVLNKQLSEKFPLLCCYPLSEERCVIVTITGFIALWNISEGDAVCEKYVQTDINGPSVNIRRVGNALFVLAGSNEKELKAYSLKDLSPIIVPKNRYLDIEVNETQLFATVLFPSKSGLNCRSLIVYNVKEDGSVEEPALWKYQDPEDNALYLKHVNERWVWGEFSLPEVDFWEIRLFAAKSGKQVAKMKVTTRKFLCSELGADLLFLGTHNKVCSWHIPSYQRLPILKVTKAIVSRQGFKVSFGENAISIIYSSQEGSHIVAQIKRYALS